jgi:alkaline phosphatase D
MRIHDRFVWGRLAEIWTLDNRQYRDVQACADGAGGNVVVPCDELQAEARSMFGAAQERWLAQGLAASRRRWKLLGQGTQISPSGVDSAFVRRIHTDGWDGYPKARERLLRAIAEPRVADVLCLGGDVHRHVAAQLRLRGNDERSPIVASEFVCSSVTTRGLSEALTALLRASNPDIVHARSDERGYALIELNAKAAECDFRATPFPADAGARLTKQARYVVEQGRPGVQAA